MNCVILDGSLAADDAVSASLVAALQQSLSRAGAPVRLFKMRDLQMARCEGDFRCWVETPGVCHIEDDGREIARAVHDSDALFLVGPSSFGGYPSQVKKGLDRIIGLVLPFFASRGGQTHHAARYSRSPSLLAALWHPHPSQELNRTVQRLVQRNAINLLAPRHAAVLLGPSPEAWGKALDDLVCVAQRTGSDVPPDADPALEHRALLDAASASQVETGPAPLRSVVLVGSARPRATSTSEVLGSALVPRGGEMVHFVTEFVHDGGAAQRCIEDVLASDLFVLASPLYVDSLPFLATRALERIASAAARSAKRPR
ncbi:MAG: NAD(P)H-dependent oxidoreductase, partial [Myxococcales bacterium]